LDVDEEWNEEGVEDEEDWADKSHTKQDCPNVQNNLVNAFFVLL